jgi:hypothetical protein
MIDKLTGLEHPSALFPKLVEIVEGINELERRVDALMKRVPSADVINTCTDCGVALHVDDNWRLCKPCYRQQSDTFNG